MLSADDTIKALAATVCTTHDETAPATARPPYAVLHGGGTITETRHLCGGWASRHETLQLVAVSNNRRGAVILANRLRDALDNASTSDGSTLEVVMTSPPLDDRTDPSTVLWSCTLEIRHEIPR